MISNQIIRSRRLIAVPTPRGGRPWPPSSRRWAGARASRVSRGGVWHAEVSARQGKRFPHQLRRRFPLVKSTGAQNRHGLHRAMRPAAQGGGPIGGARRRAGRVPTQCVGARKQGLSQWPPAGPIPPSARVSRKRIGARFDTCDVSCAMVVSSPGRLLSAMVSGRAPPGASRAPCGARRCGRFLLRAAGRGRGRASRLRRVRSRRRSAPALSPARRDAP